MSAGKSGIAYPGKKLPPPLARDIKLYGNLRKCRTYSEYFAKAYGDKTDDLSVYIYHPFPLTFHLGVKTLPSWKHLTLWMKVQLSVMLLDEWRDKFLTFTVNLHPDLEDKWVKASLDPLAMMRDRFRKELNKELGSAAEYFFAVEGEKRGGGTTRLHYHGGIRVTPENKGRVIAAMGRAAGHGIKGYTPTKRAVHTTPFRGGDDYWPNYVMKSMYSGDHRLRERRVSMSRPLVQASAKFWDWISRGDP